MAHQLRIRLEGKSARPGEIAASDVAKAILGLERALARAAVLVAPRNRRRGNTGRHKAVIERATKLRFVSTSAGSFVTTLSLPEGSIDDDVLPMDNLETLSMAALTKTLEAIQHPGPEVDRHLASALAQLGEQLGVGERTRRVTIQELAQSGRRPLRQAVLDAAARRQMLVWSQPRQALSDTDRAVSGALVEADFERLTARLRLYSGDPIDVTFTEDRAEEIKQALRNPTTVVGQAHFEPSTGLVTRVDIRSVQPTEQLVLTVVDEFSRHLSFRELQQQQGVTGIFDLEQIFDAEATDEEAEAYISAANR